MSTNPSDYEERVLHFVRSKNGAEVTVREVSEATNVKFLTASRILSHFEDLELVERVTIHHHLSFRWSAKKRALSLRRVRALMDRSAQIARQRRTELKRNMAYERTR